MICYKDKNWCPFWDKCKNGNTCSRALTPLVEVEAMTWWRGENPPICQYLEKPDCFKRIE